jgi:hypothetical protein
MREKKLFYIHRDDIKSMRQLAIIFLFYKKKSDLLSFINFS